VKRLDPIISYGRRTAAVFPKASSRYCHEPAKQTRAGSDAQELREVEHLYAETQADSSQSGYSRQLTLRSLRRTVNQLKEEIARFEAHTSSTAMDK
jgi:hypothetical protein